MKIVIIGSAYEGLLQVQRLRERGRMQGQADILICEKSCFASFGQEFLKKCTGWSLDKIREEYQKEEEKLRLGNISLRLLTKALLVDPENRVVTLQRAWKETPEQLSYDLLILATGRSERVPDVPGRNLFGVQTLGSLEDFLLFREMTKSRFAHFIALQGENPVILSLCRVLREQGREVTLYGQEGDVLGFTGDVFVDGIRTRNGIFPCDLYLSGCKSTKPQEYLHSLPQAVTADGGLTVDAEGETPYAGVFAAGSLACPAT